MVQLCTYKMDILDKTINDHHNNTRHNSARCAKSAKTIPLILHVLEITVLSSNTHWGSQNPRTQYAPERGINEAICSRPASYACCCYHLAKNYFQLHEITTMASLSHVGYISNTATSKEKLLQHQEPNSNKQKTNKPRQIHELTWMPMFQIPNSCRGKLTRWIRSQCGLCDPPSPEECCHYVYNKRLKWHNNAHQELPNINNQHHRHSWKHRDQKITMILQFNKTLIMICGDCQRVKSNARTCTQSGSSYNWN